MFFIFPADILAAKTSKENPTATCTNEQKILKTEPAQTTAEDGKQMVIDKIPQRESSVEDCKPQTLKEDGQLLEGHTETPEEMKKEDEKMENEQCTEAAASSAEKGKYHSLYFPKLYILFFVNFLCDL